MAKELNVLALIKGEQRYVYVYDDDSRDALVERVHAHAADPRLDLNWFDAVILAGKADEQTAGRPAHARRF